MAANTYETPGVYVVEQDGFSSSVVAVPTAVPVFIGYTEVARNGKQDLTGQAIPLTSMLDFLKFYGDPQGNGGAPAPKFAYYATPPTMPACAFDSDYPRFNLFYALTMFYMNGGGNCYVVSIGSYDDGKKAFLAAPYNAAFTELQKHSEPTMLVMPDSVLLAAADWTAVAQEALVHCNLMQNRVAIFDVWNGYLPADNTINDPIKGVSDGSTGFYTASTKGEDFNKYGVGYYPWINTTVTPTSSITFNWLTDAGIALLQADLLLEAKQLLSLPAQATRLTAYLAKLATLAPGIPDAIAATLHGVILTLSPLYKQLLLDLASAVNLLPPAGAMAGVYALNDATSGVWQSPANTGIIGAVSACVTLSDNDQNELNMPLNGCAVNALRTFPNFGLLVWGARTMAGNSDDWRYINVRRTISMLEASIKVALHQFVFQSNTELTWTHVYSTIDNFLNTQWQAGALQGAKPSDAYSISLGLGKTMTAEDILQGYLRITVKLAVVHPAEFIVLTFVQQAAVS